MSKILTLNLRDWFKGAIVATLSAVLTLIIQLLQNGLTIDWKMVGSTAVIATLSYIVKQLATDENGKLLGKI